MRNSISLRAVLVFSLAAAILGLAAAPAGAAPLYWDNAASAGLWIDDGATFNWSATLGGVAGVYTDSAWVGGSETIAHFEGTAGVVTLDSAGIASVGSISFDTDGYTLGNVVDNGTITLTGTGGNITTGAGLNTINSIIGGGVGLTKLGTGTLVLAGTNGYTGGTTISNGTLQFTQLVAMPASGIVAMNTGTTLAVNVGGTGEWTTGTSGVGTVGGLLAGDGGQTVGTVSYSGNVTLGLVTTGTQTYAGNIGNVGTSLSLAKSGAGTLILSGTGNTYTGTTTLTAGTLQGLVTGTSLTPVSPFGAGSLALNGGTLQLRASGTLNATAETITLGNNTTVGGTTTINVDRPGATSTTKTILLGTLAIGGQTLNVTGANSYGLRFGAATASGAATFNPTSAPLTLASLTLDNSVPTGTTTTVTLGGTNAGSSINNITNNGGDPTKVLALATSGNSTWNLGGTSSYSGGTTINAGATIVVNSSSALGSGTVTIAGNASLTPNHSVYPVLNNSLVVNDGVTFTINNSSQYWSAAFNGVASGSGTIRYGGNNNGNNGWSLGLFSAANTFTGTLTSASGSNGVVALVNSFADSANPINLNGAIFTLNSGTVTPLLFNSRNITLSGTTAGGTVNNNNGTASNTITINTDLLITGVGNKTFTLGGSNGGANTFGGKIADSTGSTISLTKAGAGTWVLSGANTYTGKTTISAGTLSINSIQDADSATANALGTPAVGANSIIALAATGTLKYTGTGHSSNRVINLTTAAGGTFTLDASGPSGTFALTGGVTNAGTSATSTLALTGTGLGSESGSIVNGTVTNVAAVTKSGTGTWMLSGANTYTGATTVSAGALQAVPGTGLPSTSYLRLDGGVLQASGAFTRANSTTAGGANFQWMSVNGGGFAANGGKLTVTVNNNAATEQVWGTAAASNGIWGTLKFGSATANAETEFQNNINLAAATRTVDVAAGAGGDFATLSGVISTATGTAGLTKTGAGLLNLIAANTYNGATTVSAGTLTLSGANGAIASSTGPLAVGTAGGTAGALTLDNAAANNADRVGSVALSLNNGTVNFIGKTSSASTETIGAITAASGSNLINLSGGASDQVAVLTSTGSSITRTAGAAINVVADNINQQFKLTGGAAGMIDKGLYFNANDFAYLDGTGNLRAPAYGTDGGFETVDTVTADMHVKLANTMASQGAVSLKTLNLAGTNVGITALTGNLTFTNSATEGGIIKSGDGAAQIGTAGDAFDIVGQTGGELVVNTVAAADNLTLNVGIAASSTALTKVGAGTLTLTANRDYLYTGATTVNAGTLVLNSLTTDGFKSTAITINNGGTARLDAADKVVNTALVTVNAGGTLNMAGFNDSIGALAGSGSVTNSTDSSTLTLKSGTQTFSGVISGTGLTLKVDGASQTLSGTSTYGGGTVLNAGTLSTSADVNLGSGGGITVNGTATWNFGGTTYARSLTVNEGAVLSINGNQSGARAVSGVLSGNGTIAVTSSDVATFSNPNNTFTGTVNTGYGMSFGSLGDSSNPINYSGGSLTWTGGAKTFALRPFTLNAAGGATLNSSGSGAIIIQQPLAFSGAAGARTLTLGGSYTGANQFAGNIADSVSPASVVSLTKAAGVSIWALSGTNTYTGATTASQATGNPGSMVFQGIQALSPYTSLRGGTNPSDGGTIPPTFKILDDSASPASRSTVNLFLSTGNGQDPLTIFVGNNNISNGGNSSGTTTGSTIQLGNMNFSQVTTTTAGGALNVQGANGYKLQIANVSITLGGTGTPVAWNTKLNPTTASLIVTGNVQQTANGVGSVTTNLQLDGTATDNLISGNILNSADGSPRALSVSKAGSSTWTLSGTNTYTGVTTLSAGTLNANAASALGAGNVTVSAGTLVIGAANAMADTAALRLPSAAAKNLTMNFNDTVGSLFLGGVPQPNNTYTSSGLGIAWMNPGSGILTVGSAAAQPRYWDLDGETPGAGSTAGDATGTWNATAKWNSLADGSGPAAPWSAGAVPTFAAGTDASGTYAVTVEGTQEIGGLTFEEGNVTLAAGAAGGLRMTSDTLAYVNTGLSATVSTPISQDATARALTKIGAGTLVLSGANAYAGATTVSAGTLQLSHADAIGGTLGNLIVQGGGVVVDSGVAVNLKSLKFDNIGTSLTVSGGTLAFSPGGSISNSDNRYDQTITSAITGSPNVYIKDYRPDGGNDTYLGIKFAPTSGTVTLGAVLNPDNTGTKDKSGITLAGSTTGNSVASINYAGGDQYANTNVQSGEWTVGSIRTGTLRLTGGTLILNGTFTPMYQGFPTFASGARLGGNGTSNAAVSAPSGAIIAPGDPASAGGVGTFTVTKTVTMNDGAKYEWQIGAGVTDILNITSGTLDLNNFVLKIFDAGGSVTSGAQLPVFTYAATGVTIDMAGFGNTGANFDTTALGSGWTIGTLALTNDTVTRIIYLTGLSTTVLGDTNGDFVVDAADYIAIKTNFGLTGIGATLAKGNVTGAMGEAGTVDWADLQLLMANFGTRSVGGAPATPEPATLGLLAIGALAVLRRRRRS